MLPCAYQLINICTSISSIRVLNHVHVKERGCWLDSLWTPPPCSVPSFVPNAPVSGFSTVRFPHLGYPGKCLSARNLDQPCLHVLERTDIRPANKTTNCSICTKQRCSLWTKQRCSGLMFWSMNKTNLFGIWTEQRSAWLIKSIYNFICKNSGTM